MEENLPKATDQLFKEESNFETGAWIKTPADKFFLYSEGYKKAAETLYKLCEESSYHNNSIVYPLIFNYRQYCELRLKELIIMGYKYLDQPKDFKDEHHLSNLWNVYRNEILKNVENSIDINALDNVERIINQFNNKDPKSMSFRYPVTKGPIRTESVTMNSIDLKNFKEIMDKLVYFFEWQWDMLSHYSDMKGEMLADMYSNYY
jgi:hypothetical protein